MCESVSMSSSATASDHSRVLGVNAAHLLHFTLLFGLNSSSQDYCRKQEHAELTGSQHQLLPPPPNSPPKKQYLIFSMDTEFTSPVKLNNKRKGCVCI